MKHRSNKFKDAVRDEILLLNNHSMFAADACDAPLPEVEAAIFGALLARHPEVPPHLWAQAVNRQVPGHTAMLVPLVGEETVAFARQQIGHRERPLDPAVLQGMPPGDTSALVGWLACMQVHSFAAWKRASACGASRA